MKRFAKLLCTLLCISLLFSVLSVGGFAVWNQCQRSPQSLKVDGRTIECDKYNINGSNYFKLRDIAYLLNGTGSSFSVSWNAELGQVGIDTGMPYVPDSSELVISEDKSNTAVKSTQSIVINGIERKDLTVYNIGNNNYFKLRDLGKALNFDVDYDAKSNTAVVISDIDGDLNPELREIWYVHDVNELVESFGSNRTVYIAPGEYNLTEWTSFYTENEAFRSNYDCISEEYATDSYAPEVRLQSCMNLKLIGSGEGITKIVCEPRYANVLGFDGCENITVKSMTVGHT